MAHEKIAEVTLQNAAQTVDFTNIPQNYKGLEIYVLAAANSGGQAFDSFVRVNGVAASSYGYSYLRLVAPDFYPTTSSTSWGRLTSIQGTYLPGYSMQILEIPQYSVSSAVGRTAIYRGMDRQGSLLVTGGAVNFYIGAAITSVTIGSTDNSIGFTPGSKFFIYGLA